MATKRSLEDVDSDVTRSSPEHDETMADDERAAKRHKGLAENAEPQDELMEPQNDAEPEENTLVEPNAIAEIVEQGRGGDTFLIVQSLGGIQKPTGIRVSSHVLRTTSPVFAEIFNAFENPPYEERSYSATGERLIELPNDDGDALYLLCSILHLRNDHLPQKLQADFLFRLVSVVLKYSCVVPVSRCITQWFEYLWTACQKHIDPVHPEYPLFRLVEAAYLLNDALYFARFTSRWVLNTPLDQVPSDQAPHLVPKPLAQALIQRRKDLRNQTLISDLDLLLEAISEALCDDAKHMVDCPPGDESTSEDDDKQPCNVDRETSTELLSALRDAGLWPSSKWPDTIGRFSERVAIFRVPDYDASSETCEWCYQVDDKFVTALHLLQKIHQDRLWGLCLDCHQAGGVYIGECRFQHPKLPVASKNGGSGGGGGPLENLHANLSHQWQAAGHQIPSWSAGAPNGPPPPTTNHPTAVPANPQTTAETAAHHARLRAAQIARQQQAIVAPLPANAPTVHHAIMNMRALGALPPNNSAAAAIIAARQNRNNQQQAQVRAPMQQRANTGASNYPTASGANGQSG